MCGCKGKCGCNIISTTKGEKGDASPVASLGYKVYKALISQSSTNAPTVTVLQNTIGDIVWTRDGVGVYLGTLANAFTANKTFLPQPSQNNSNKSIVLFRTGVNVIEIDTFDITNTLADSLLNENSICIEVYP